MGFLRNEQASVHALNPAEDSAFDEVLITGDYDEASIATGLLIIKRATTAELLAVVPATGLALGVSGEGTNTADTVFLYVGGAWAAFLGT